MLDKFLGRQDNHHRFLKFSDRAIQASIIQLQLYGSAEWLTNMANLNVAEEELDFLRKLDQNKVRFLLIGGYAMKYFGCNRRAADIDLLIDNSFDNAHKLYPLVVEALGYEPKFKVEELTLSNKQLRINKKIDILTSVDGLEFSQAFQKRELKLEKGVAIPIVSKEHLIYIKELAAKDEKRRLKELRDIECLKSTSTV